MPAPGIRQFRKLPESIRNRIDVATAMAWQALVEAHAQQAQEFTELFSDRLPLEEGLSRYVQEMDMSDTMAAAVRTRMLATLKEGESKAAKTSTVDIPRRGEGELTEEGAEQEG